MYSVAVTVYCLCALFSLCCLTSSCTPCIGVRKAASFTSDAGQTGRKTRQQQSMFCALSFSCTYQSLHKQNPLLGYRQRAG